MKKFLLMFLVIFAVVGIAYAHGTILVQPKSFEFYDKAGIVSVVLSEDNQLQIRLNTFELGTRDNFCELK